MTLLRVATATLLLLAFAHCTDTETVYGDPILARGHQKVLRLSELEGMFPSNATAEDSLLIKGAFVRRWSRETVLVWNAERNLPSDMKIDRLVRHYRASLVRSHYEEQ